MDSEALSAVRQMFDEINQAVPRQPSAQADHARHLFSLLARDGGQVEAIGEPKYWRTKIDELGTWTEDPWEGPTYGVDASTTRPIEYNNGLVVDTAYAKTAVTGDGAERSIELSGRIAGAAYYDDADTTLRSMSLEGEYVTAELVRFPQLEEEPQNVAKAVASVAQGLSESQQAHASLEDINGALFLDGAILPLGIVYWVLLDYAGGRSPAGDWDVPEEIISTYIEVIDRQWECDQPVIGIVKTSSMAQVLAALREKITLNDIRDENGRLLDLPWTRDHQFMSEVLRFDNLEYLTYTSWFVHKRQKVGGNLYELLEPLANRVGNGDPGDYRRAFCYVRLPKTGDLFRIEVPKLMIQDDERREEIRLKTLKEIAQRQGVPPAIHRADRLARISRENRDTIRNMITQTEYSYDYNWDGRWSDLDDAFTL